MIVLGNARYYQSPSAALLHAMSVPVELPVADPTYDTRGRQSTFHETTLQRHARVEFLRHRTGRRRVEEWVKSQMQNSVTTVLANPTPLPSSSPRLRRQQNLRRSTSKPYVSSPLSYTSIAACDLAPARQVLYDVPEDSDEPIGYREPHIFYSSAESVSPGPTQLIAPIPKYPSQLVRMSSPPSPSSSSSSSPSPKRQRHARRLSDLDDIPEDLELEA